MKKYTQEEKLTLQLYFSIFIGTCGVLLLIMGFFANPIGWISNSVIISCGELATWSASLMGISYTYQYKALKYTTLNKIKENIENTPSEQEHSEDKNEE